MDTSRIILHCDLNCFYASVELLDKPALWEVPVAVGGDPEARHGVVLAKNEPAKRRGVKTGESLYEARKKAPGLVVLPPHHDLYRQYSRVVNEIYGHYTDLVEPFGIDESWLDITGSAHLFGGNPKAIADELRARVKRETGLSISVGISFNKVFAKLGSDYKKPDATTVISAENWQQIVWPLSVGELLYVGNAAKKVLHSIGIDTIGQLAAAKRDVLETLLGKMGLQLHDYANGVDPSPVRPQAEEVMPKSVGNGTTYARDLVRREDIHSNLLVLSDSVALRMRRHGLYCGGVAVQLKYADFRTVSRQKQLASPTHLTKDIHRAACELTDALWHAPEPIRAMTVTAMYLTDSQHSYEQLDLLGAAAQKQDEKQEKITSAMDAIREKYGVESIRFGNAKPLRWED